VIREPQALAGEGHLIRFASTETGSDNSCFPDIDPDCTYMPPPLVGDGNLRLDGETGYAASDEPVVDTGDSSPSVSYDLRTPSRPTR
jgi:hypothetical protein